MWAIPVTAFIIVAGLLALQWMEDLFEARKREEAMFHTNETVNPKSDRIDKLEKEFVEYKSRVDSLVLKAGFKL